MIRLQKLCKDYPTAHGVFQALLDVTVHIEAGEIFGIIGKSGAGKSTLIRCINLLERPSSGSVFLDNVELTALSLSQLNEARRRIGMIFQHFNLLDSRNVRENIALPLEIARLPRAEIEQRVDEFLKWVDLEEHGAHYPRQLSGGQKQRVAIARALAGKPNVLLCDEATSALDPESTLSILELLKRINREFKLTIVLITHEMNVIKSICDRVGVLEKGRLVEHAPVLDLFTDPQHATSKRLIQHALSAELPAPIARMIAEKKNQGSAPVIRLTFVGNDAGEPLTSRLHQQFQVSVNILQANLDFIKDEAIGFILCQLDGEAAQIEKALEYLAGAGLKMEVVGYG